MALERAFRFLDGGHPYLPGLWDLSADAAAAREWLDVLRTSMHRIVRRVERDDPDRSAAVREAAAWFHARLSEWESDADLRARRNTVHTLVEWREYALRAFEVGDPFERLKRDENDRCLLEYGSVVEALDALEDTRRALDVALWGVVAGNVFDVAAPVVSAALDEGSGLDALVRDVRRRPLLVDDRVVVSEQLERLFRAGGPKVALFVDNAGMDFVLGVLPLVRLLARRGARVVLVANEYPALNDVTAAEAADILHGLAETDPVMADVLSDGRLTLRSGGLGSTGLDLRRVPDALNDAVEGAELLILDGQGRGVETTWTARLTIPSLRVATLKSEAVAAKLGGTAFDSIVSFRPG